jgi:hypothetical protein
MAPFVVLYTPGVLPPYKREKAKAQTYLSDPIASWTSKSIGCSHHQRHGIAPLLRSPRLHSLRIGQVATYTAIVCRQAKMYFSIIFIPHSFNTSSDLGYIHSRFGPLFGLFFLAILYAAQI